MSRKPFKAKFKSYGTERMQFPSTGVVDLDFGSKDEPLVIAVPSKVRELVLQGRMCGDFYAEVSGPGFCVAFHHTSVVEAAKGAFAKAPA